MSFVHPTRGDIEGYLASEGVDRYTVIERTGQLLFLFPRRFYPMKRPFWRGLENLRAIRVPFDYGVLPWWRNRFKNSRRQWKYDF